MRPLNRRDLAAVEAILALDWLAAPRTGLEYLEAVNAGRKWNDHVRNLKAPTARRSRRETKTRPLTFMKNLID